MYNTYSKGIVKRGLVYHASILRSCSSFVPGDYVWRPKCNVPFIAIMDKPSNHGPVLYLGQFESGEWEHAAKLFGKDGPWCIGEIFSAQNMGILLMVSSRSKPG